MFGKTGSKILKLPPVSNCFTLAVTNKLVVIINSLKVPKIKKILLYEMKFLVPKLQPLTRGLPPQYTRSLRPLSSTKFVEPPPPEQNSWVRHCQDFLILSTGCIVFRIIPTKNTVRCP